MLKSPILDVLGTPPFSRLPQIFAKYLTGYCKTCKDERLDLLFTFYGDRKMKLCHACKVHAKIFVFLVDALLSSLNLEEERRGVFFTGKYRRISKSIVKGLANFGVRRPFVTGTPVAVVWNYTDKCNLHCRHCYANANSLQVPELTTKERYKVIDRLVEGDVVSLNFSGGEPLVRRDLFKVAQYAFDAGLTVSVSTNATLITRKIVKQLMKCGITGVDASVDGMTPETHDWIRNVTGSFSRTVKGIDNCVKYGMFSEIIVNTTLTQFTVNEIPRIYTFAKELGATRYYVSRILPAGRGKAFLQYDVTPEDKIRVLNFLYQKLQSYINGGDDIACLTRGMTYFSRVCYEKSSGTILPACEILTGYEKEHYPYFEGQLPAMILQMKENFSGCAAGLNYCGLDPTGEVLPCAPASQIKLGKLLENRLEDLWVNHPVFNTVRARKKVKGKCSRCPSEEYCGGCRLTSYGVTGDWLDQDPSCPFEARALSEAHTLSERFYLASQFI